jgi:hypothetical protein
VDTMSVSLNAIRARPVRDAPGTSSPHAQAFRRSSKNLRSSGLRAREMARRK